jgi:hypothetical protein
MAFRIRKPSQESFFALNAIPLYSYAIPLPCGGGLGRGARRCIHLKDRPFICECRAIPPPQPSPTRGEGVTADPIKFSDSGH